MKNFFNSNKTSVCRTLGLVNIHVYRQGLYLCNAMNVEKHIIRKIHIYSTISTSCGQIRTQCLNKLSTSYSQSVDNLICG